MILLKSEDRKRLKFLQQTNKDKKVYVKVTTILMFDQGFTSEQISTALGISESTVNRYKRTYSLNDLDSYLDNNIVNYTGKLNTDQEQKLRDQLTEYLYITTKEIREYIKYEFDVEYSKEGVRLLLKRLGFSYKKTKSIPQKANKEVQDKFSKKLKRLHNRLKDNAEIYFVDGVHPQYNTKPAYGWILKGKEYQIPANSGRQRININGALNGRDVTDVEIVEGMVNTQSTIELYEKLEEKNKGKVIYIVCDNARYYHAKLLKEWLSQHKNFRIIYLPPYSPNLNLIERLWKHLRKEVINYSFYETFEEFKASVRYFFKNIKDYKDALESLITWNFQTL